MGKKYLLIFFMLIIMLSGLSFGATVHGTIYDNDLEAIKKVVVEVNSTPLQRHISKFGGYSFELEPGKYHIWALYTSDGITEKISEEYVSVTSNSGDYIVDLFVFPEADLSPDAPPESDGIDLSFLVWLVVSALAVIIGVMVLLWVRRYTGKKGPESVVEYKIEYDAPDSSIEEISVEEIPVSSPSISEKPKPVEVSFESENDLLKKRILKLVEETEGGISQKDIRKKIKLSESKISQVITDLVQEGLLAKIKKGRSNIILKT